MKLFVHTADGEQPELVDVEATALVRTLLVGVDADERVWVEELDEEVDLDVTFEVARIGHHHHIHRGRCRRIEVVVRYNGAEYERVFGPAATIKRVQKWAFGPKGTGFSAEQAAEHVLAQPGADHALESSVHLGSLATAGSCRVILDAVAQSRFAG
jgi:hypothetical protein